VSAILPGSAQSWPVAHIGIAPVDEAASPAEQTGAGTVLGEPSSAVAFSQPFCESGEKRPLSAAVKSPETHPYFGTPFLHQIAIRFGGIRRRQRERSKRAEIGGRIRTFFQTLERSVSARL
jgi:hypothetical protein